MTNANINQTILNRSRQPLYLQLAAEFKRSIDTGLWLVGERIPVLEELMQTYQVSRMTIRHALEILENEQLIRRIRGKGTFVERRTPQTTGMAIPTTWEEAVGLSDVLGTHSITESENQNTVLPVFDMLCKGKPTPAYQYLCRLHSNNDVPYCYSEVYIDNALFEQHREKFLKMAAASVIARIPSLKITESRQKLTIINAGFQSANALNLEVGESVAEVQRFACADNKIIYYARLEFPTRFVTLDLDLLATSRKG